MKKKIVKIAGNDFPIKDSDIREALFCDRCGIDLDLPENVQKTGGLYPVGNTKMYLSDGHHQQNESQTFKETCLDCHQIVEVILKDPSMDQAIRNLFNIKTLTGESDENSSN